MKLSSVSIYSSVLINSLVIHNELWTLQPLSYLFTDQTGGNIEGSNPIVKLVSSKVGSSEVTESFIKGEIRKNAVDKYSRFSAFHAIPYALAPIGELRFKKPVPYGPSYGNANDPFDATNPSNDKSCPQEATDNFIHKESREEDCLTLSVYTPKLSFNSGNDTLLPVLFWIHGGFFEHGSGMYYHYGPDRFMKDGDMVMVSINYRLGVLGFLSLANPELPGNMGLWDQRLALDWVKYYITFFGGNPDMVTIMGESAGSWSVAYHVLSPQSHGLFHRAIAQSGTPMSTSCHDLPGAKAKK